MLRSREAAEDDLSHSEFLLRLLTDDVEHREAKQLDLRLRRASFEHAKSLEDFDFTFNPKSRIIDLATCGFVERRENVLLCGKTGGGKSHIGQAFGHRACMAGHSVLYTSADEMLRLLRASRADGSHGRKLLRYVSPDLLIIDDLGLRGLVHDEPIDLYEIIRRRYERGSVILTSNRAVQEWPPLFKAELLASAAMDRLLHHAHVIEIDGDSYHNRLGEEAVAGPRDDRDASLSGELGSSTSWHRSLGPPWARIDAFPSGELATFPSPEP